MPVMDMGVMMSINRYFNRVWVNIAMALINYMLSVIQ